MATARRECGAEPDWDAGGVGPCRGDGRPLVRLPPWPNPTVYSIFSKGTYP